jgi:hypothetical protein
MMAGICIEDELRCKSVTSPSTCTDFTFDEPRMCSRTYSPGPVLDFSYWCNEWAKSFALFWASAYYTDLGFCTLESYTCDGNYYEEGLRVGALTAGEDDAAGMATICSQYNENVLAGDAQQLPYLEEACGDERSNADAGAAKKDTADNDDTAGGAYLIWAILATVVALVTVALLVTKTRNAGPSAPWGPADESSRQSVASFRESSFRGARESAIGFPNRQVTVTGI